MSTVIYETRDKFEVICIKNLYIKSNDIPLYHFKKGDKYEASFVTNAVIAHKNPYSIKPNDSSVSLSCINITQNDMDIYFKTKDQYREERLKQILT